MEKNTDIGSRMNIRSVSFESPDVEKEFPGLYASERARAMSKDFSEETGKARGKKDAGRKKEFKKEKKDKGYHMFEQEDSEEERLVLADDTRSPSKMKKHSKPSFKFAKKDKLYKVKEKSDKEERKDDGRKQERDGDKKKEKLKFRKKAKSKLESQASQADMKPIFGVPLAVAVERNKSHDGVPLPAMVRECIDYIEEFGLGCEGIYRISGVKSKVQALKEAYNKGQPVYLAEHEPNIVASLLKLFLRELPEPVLTADLMQKFEQTSTLKNIKQKVEGFQQLIQQLPAPNRLLLSFMIVHMTHVIAREKQNKMSLQNVSIVLSPTMQISHRVLNVFFSFAKILFRDVTITKYVPPLKPVTSRWSLELPESPTAIEEELRKQESLLSHLHEEIAKGEKNEQKEEQLWEVQRVCTQLKRKLKNARKAHAIQMEAEQREREIVEEKHREGTPSRKLSKEKSPLSSREKKEESSQAIKGAPVLKKQVQVKESEAPPQEKGKEEKQTLKVRESPPLAPKVGGIVGVPDLGAPSPTHHKPTLEQQLMAEKRRAEEEARAAKQEVKEKTKSEGPAEGEQNEKTAATQEAKAAAAAKQRKKKMKAPPVPGTIQEETGDSPQPDSANMQNERTAKTRTKPKKRTAPAIPNRDNERAEVDPDSKEVSVVINKEAIEGDNKINKEVEDSKDHVDDSVDTKTEKFGKGKKRGSPELTANREKDEQSESSESVQSVVDESESREESPVEPVERVTKEDNKASEVHRAEQREAEEKPDSGEKEVLEPESDERTPTNQDQAEEEEEKQVSGAVVKEEDKEEEPKAPSQVASESQPPPAVLKDDKTAAEIKALPSVVQPTKITKLQSPLQPQKVYHPQEEESDSDTEPRSLHTVSEERPGSPESPGGITMEAQGSQTPRQEFDATRELWEAFGDTEGATPDSQGGHSLYGEDDITDKEYDAMQQEYISLQLEEEELISLRDELRKKIEAEKSEIERLHQEMADLQAIREDLYDSDSSATSSSSREDADEDELYEMLQRLEIQNAKLQMENDDLNAKIHSERQACLEVKVKIRVIQKQRNEPPPDIALIEL